ncbi:TIGR02678 family protein [Murinocardiopsis flavida]|uniref:TIGR02678 family protein n=1 Tax=Murinocardiopsis flavida TaxID=645275 RepID=UPI000D0D8271|nr:TIGR02678 family protein [Murinocardiopsis flavida]
MSGSLDESNRARQESERRKAARALLREPLLRAHGRTADDFRLVRQYAAELRTWFDRNTGWPLHVDAETVRLRKIPGDTGDPTHPARETRGGHLAFTRRRYVLFCLALAVLERSEAQIALGRLAEQTVLEAADPRLAATGIAFTLQDRDERADLVAVVRMLLRLGVLDRVAGDEDAYLKASGDVLYDVRRRVLSEMLSGRRGPSTITEDGAAERVAALAADPASAVLDSDDLRNQAMRHRITRRLLDDPVLYFATLTDAERAYLTGQRAAVTGRITELTGLVAEVRAEGIAMVDPEDDLTDVRMPEQGTHGHVTLLLAEHLAAAAGPVPVAELERRVRELGEEHASFWAKTARAPGAESDLVARAVAKLRALLLVRVGADGAVCALPALARYAVAAPVVRETRPPTDERSTP